MGYDIVIYGASGFTGQFVVEFLIRALQKDGNRGLSWAVAGRSESKLKAVLETAAKNTGASGDAAVSDVPIVICDSGDRDSLVSMVKQARLILNCAGPYRFLGEPVVEVCVENGVHHLDISGEPEYLEKMQLKYHTSAAEKGVYVVGSCGFDSIPADLGQIFLAEKMGGDVNDVETYLEIETPENLSGPRINYGTWQSAIYGFANAGNLKSIRKALYPEKLPSLKPKLISRGSVHKSDVVGGWCLPFPGSDRSVMIRTQRSRFTNDGERPTQVGCYFKVASLFSVIMIMFFGALFGLLANFKFGRYLLETYPEFFSMGAVSKAGPSKEVAENTNFKLTLVGRGWNDKVKDRTTDDDNPDKKVTVTVKGKNIGYGMTCEALVQSGLVLLQEKDKIPGSGGVLTPGYAFAKTSLIQRLNENNVPFTLESIESI